MRRPCRILLIDDSPLQCLLWRRLLEKRYATAVTLEAFVDPAAAIDRLDIDLDLLIVDWEMPVHDGGEVVAVAIARGIDPSRIVLLSGHPPEWLAERAGAGAYLALLHKDSEESREKLLALVDRVIARPPETIPATASARADHERR